MTRNVRAFTLVELLIVIGIISILATLFSPMIGRAKQKALSVGCGSNLKRLATAVLTAATDNDDSFPVIEAYENFGDAYPEGAKVLTIYEALSPYGITKKDLACPADTFPQTGEYRLSYCWNYKASEEKENAITIYGRRSTFAAKLSKIWLFKDIMDNHHGRANRVYGDGHVALY